MHLSNALMAEVPSFPMSITVIEPLLVHVLEHIKLLPSVMSVIIDSVGRVETQAATYFACYVNPPTSSASSVDVAQFHATTITPDNIRELLRLAVSGTAAQRLRLRELWSIPGARFSDAGLLENGDEIYPPDYGHEQPVIPGF